MSLFEAIPQGVDAIADALLAGADKNAVNDKGETAEQVAPDEDSANVIRSWPVEPYDVPAAIKTSGEKLQTLAASIASTEQQCEQLVQQIQQTKAQFIEDLLRRMQEAENDAEQKTLSAQAARDLQVSLLRKTEHSVAVLEQALKKRDQEFMDLVVRDLRKLTASQVIALLRRQNFNFDETKFKDITGEILAEIQEGDVEPYLGIRDFGTRKRLMSLIRKLKQHNPIKDLIIPTNVEFKEGDTLPSNPYTWNVSQVTEWLRKEHIKELIECFRTEQITGEVLMDLTGADLRAMGVQQLGPRILCEKKIAELRKPYVEPNGDNPMSAEQVQTILRQHADVEKQLTELSERNSARLVGDTRAVPTDFLCPITRGIMEDPVIAADTLTYERVAIEAWFIEHETSPITRQVIQKTLIPNAALRRMITQFIDDRPV